jgi:hypothetical protein
MSVDLIQTGTIFEDEGRARFAIAVTCAFADANYTVEDSRPGWKKFICDNLGEFPTCPFRVTLSPVADGGPKSCRVVSSQSSHTCLPISACRIGKRSTPFQPAMFVDVCMGQLSLIYRYRRPSLS